MFKKVIGQEANEPHKASPSAREESAPQPSSIPPGRESGSASASHSQRPSAGGTRNVLSSDVDIKGTVKFQHDLIVDGKIEGEIQSAGSLTVGENARIKAEIKTGSVVIYGKVHGNMTATDKIELKSSAEVIGDIKAKILTIEAGAIFVGKSTVGTPSQGSSSAPDQKTGQGTPSGNQQPLLAGK